MVRRGEVVLELAVITAADWLVGYEDVLAIADR